MIPKAFFVTGGKAVSKVSQLNAFDLALKEAGIAQCNLVEVSSIIPPGCKEVEPQKIPIGAITYAVISKAEGTSGKISSGIAWGAEENHGYGVVAEAYGNTDEATIKKQIFGRLMEMAEIRGIKLTDVKHRIETLDVPENSYGCAVVALVYVL
ncbi:pyruvoyl-dependent arginine decarboxylase [Candidatus Bathyarchaeota archaeon]|nr:MAG: pyruvoyl-dependent arginine decarboxylase [Candidatus Bathyarchaeota archaeon]